MCVGDGGPSRGAHGTAYSRRRLVRPWKTLALRQPMRLLERSLQGSRGAVSAGDAELLPIPPGCPALPRYLQTLQLGEPKEGAWLHRADQVVLQVPAGRQTRSSGRAASILPLPSAQLHSAPSQMEAWGTQPRSQHTAATQSQAPQGHSRAPHVPCSPFPPAELFPEQPYPKKATRIRARCKCQRSFTVALQPGGSSIGLLH